MSKIFETLLREHSNSEKIYGKKLFIGTGSIQTPKIVINSLNNKKDLKLNESQPFFIPCIYTGKSFKNNLNIIIHDTFL